MTLAARIPPNVTKGRTEPRFAPPQPLRSLLEEWREEAEALGINPDPWQKVAATHLMAVGPRKKGRPRKDEPVFNWQYREVCIVAARQNGKTEILLPRILYELKQGNTVMHTAQDRRVPRKTFLRLARHVEKQHKDWNVRKANGTEEISTPDGGRYLIVAPNAGPRGESADVVIIDELREHRDQDLMDAMLPTTMARPNFQAIYLSNAGDDSSVVLNDIRKRGIEGTEPQLAYLEWSAAPERSIDDREGWAEANPSLGYGRVAMSSLEYFFNNRPAASFETEHLCRWVPSMREALVDPAVWGLCRAEEEATPHAPAMAVSMDPERKRASAAIAWTSDAGVHLQLLFDVTGDPIDTDTLAKDIREAAGRYGVRRVGYDPLTDAEIVKPFKKPEPISGQKFANASSQFTGLVAAHSLRWQDADSVTDDLTWTARKLDRETGTFEAVRAQDDRPITASLAAIRAVWLASGLKLAAPRVM